MSTPRRRKGSRSEPTLFCLALLCTCGLHWSCGRGGVRDESATSLLSGASLPSARWVFHPLRKAPTRAQLRLDAERVLEVDEAGGRWLRERGSEPSPSAFGAPEALIGVARQHAHLWALGESGTVYLFDEPLGPFTEVRTPPQSFAQASISDQGLVAVSKQGNTFFSVDLGRSWVQKRQSAFFAGIAAAENGQVLAYSVPEQWHLSRDGGRSFVRMQQSTLAPSSLLELEDGRVFARGMYDSFQWDGAGFVPHPLPERVTQTYPLPTYARASEVEAGRAVVVEGAYYWLSERTDGFPSFQFWHGPLGQPLTSVPIERPLQCESFKMTATRDRFVVLCQGAGGAEVSPELLIYQGDSGSRRLTKLELRLRGELKTVEVALRADGTLAISGVCRPQETEPACAPKGVLIRSKERTQWLDLPSTPVPNQLAYGPNGSLWAAARRLKDGDVVLFGPITSAAQPVPMLDLSERAQLPVPQEESPLELLPGARVMTLIVRSATGMVAASVDERGELLGRSEAPSRALLVHGAGRHLAALNPMRGELWLSDTGGLAWERRALPRAVCHEKKETCRAALACSEAGCVVGDELTLLGWTAGPSSLPSKLPLSAQDSLEPTPAEGLWCRPEGEWDELPGLSSIPSATDAALGAAAWVQSASFPDRAAAVSLVAPWGSASLTRKELLPAVSDASKYAFVVQPQVEGSAVLRFRVAQGGQAGPQAATELEVAWDNQVAGVLGSARVLEAFSPVELPHSPRAALSKKAEPELLSVAGPGLYLELSASGPTPGRGYFFGPGGQLERPAPIVWPTAGPSSMGWFTNVLSDSGSHERVYDGGDHGGLLRVAGGSVLVRHWKPPGQGWTFTPYLLGLWGETASEVLGGVQIAYLGDHIGFVSMQVDPVAEQFRAHFVGLGRSVAFEEPLPVPLLVDLPPRAVACSAEQRKTTPRVLAPSVTGPRRTVQVVASAEPAVELETETGVLFGSKEQPCVAAFQASSRTGVDSSQRYRALVYPDASQPSWLFRLEDNSPSGQRVQARPMRCDYAGNSP